MEVRVGWERPEKLHITLKFLGCLDGEEIHALASQLAIISRGHQPFSAELAGTGTFPNARQPRVLWLGVMKDGGATTRLANEIELACRSLGFEADDRSYRPHLTIGRIREPEKGRDIAALHETLGFGPEPFRVNEMVIYESKLTDAGSVYTPIDRYTLADL